MSPDGLSRFLGCINLHGNSYQAPTIATGSGSFMAQPILREAVEGKEDTLTEDEAVELYLEAGRADAETANLLSAFLDRKFGSDWRAKAEAKAQKARARPDAGMSRAEAYSVLGLKPGASEDEIRAAHRALMLKNHPDRGGSSDEAARINEAKDVLLGK